MARRKRGKGGKFVSSGARTVKIVRAPAPIVRVSAPRIARAPKHRRRSITRSAAGVLGGLGKGRGPIVLGAAALGLATKHGWLEKIPLLGKAGPITSFALLGWGAEEIGKVKLPKIVSDAVTAALAISAFQIGLVGTSNVVGDGVTGHYPGGAVFFDQ